MEAGLAKRAVLATDVTGSREIIRHMDNGVLVKARDSNALAEALEVMILDPRLRKNVAQNHFKRTCEEFSLDVVTKQFLGLYTRVLNSQRNEFKGDQL